MGLLDGRVALVTGAARGIGRAIAAVLAEEGAAVGVADVSPDVADVAAALGAGGGRAAAAVFDVADPSAVGRGVEALRGALGDVDVLVSNAAIVDHIAPLVSMTPAGWERELAVNLSGAFHLMQAVLPAMVARGFGRIVVVSSAAARGGLALQAGYAASKAGLIGLVETAALEHGRHGITCNAILPGLIETERVRAVPAEIRDAFARRSPIGRLGRMDEVARLVAFLASDAAGNVNGAAIPIDGGLALNTGTLGSRRRAREDPS